MLDWVQFLCRAMDHCCYDCSVANCTVRELLSHISNSCDNNCSCDNGAGSVAAFILSPYFIIVCFITPFIIIALVYHLVCKKRCGHQLDARPGSGGTVGIASLYLCCSKKKHRNQSDGSDIDGRSNRQNGENAESSGAEGIVYDVINDESQMMTAPEMQRNRAYARGLTGQK